MLLFSLAIFSILALAVTLPFVSFSYKIISFLFLAVGFLISSDLTIKEQFLLFSNIASITTFLALIPIIAIPIHSIYNDQSKINLNHKEINKNKHFSNTYWLSYGFSTIMNLGSIPITHAISTAMTKEKQDKRLKSAAILRGFSFSMMLSPIGANVAIIVENSNTSLMVVLPIAACITVMLIILDQMVTLRNFRIVQVLPSLKFLYSMVKPFLFPILLFTGLILAIIEFFNISIISTISLLVIPYTYLWCVMIGSKKDFNESFKLQITKSIPNMYPQFSVIYCVSFFVTALQKSNYQEKVNVLLNSLVTSFDLKWVLIVLLILIMFLAAIGIHLFVLYALVTSIVTPAILQIDELIYAIYMLMTIPILILIAPFVGVTAMLGNLQKQTNMEIIKGNLQTVVLLVAIIILLIFILF